MVQICWATFEAIDDYTVVFSVNKSKRYVVTPPTRLVEVRSLTESCSHTI